MADPLSIIGLILQALDTVKSCYDKVQSARKLNQAFREIYDQNELVKITFEEIRQQYKHSADEQTIANVLSKCEQDAQSLVEIYALVCETADKPWHRRYADYVRSMASDRKGKVEDLWKRILEGIDVLQGFHIFANLSTSEQIKEALTKIEEVENSLAVGNPAGGVFHGPVAKAHHGSGEDHSQIQMMVGSGYQFQGGKHDHHAAPAAPGTR